MDIYPETSFVSTPNTEANRVIHAAVQTANGFYFNHKFAVLPYLEQGNSGTVNLPNLNYTQIPNFFSDLKRINDNIPLNYPPELRDQIKKLLPEKSSITKQQIQKFHQEWHEIEEEFWNFLHEVMPKYVHNIHNVEVRITNYGTKMSYDRVSATKKQTLNCYIRQDMSTANIGEAIIQALLMANKDYLIMNWAERESIADFLIQRLVEKKLFKKYHPTIAPLMRQNDELLKKSTDYMASLGLTFEKPFKKENSLIYLNNRVISGHLTSIQHVVLSLLIDKADQVVTYDELGNIIWTQEDDFSIWAINKNIQRLRTKLTSLGAQPNCIQPVKGKGYCLNN